MRNQKEQKDWAQSGKTEHYLFLQLMKWFGEKLPELTFNQKSDFVRVPLEDAFFFGTLYDVNPRDLLLLAEIYGKYLLLEQLPVIKKLIEWCWEERPLEERAGLKKNYQKEKISLKGGHKGKSIKNVLEQIRIFLGIFKKLEAYLNSYPTHFQGYDMELDKLNQFLPGIVEIYSEYSESLVRCAYKIIREKYADYEVINPIEKVGLFLGFSQLVILFKRDSDKKGISVVCLKIFDQKDGSVGMETAFLSSMGL